MNLRELVEHTLSSTPKVVARAATVDTQVEPQLIKLLQLMMGRLSALETGVGGMTVDILLDGLAKGVNVRLAPIEERLAELERSSFSYEGVHQVGRSYAKNSFVTCDGSMWTSRQETSHRPGHSEDWQLCVKHGRDLR